MKRILTKIGLEQHKIRGIASISKRDLYGACEPYGRKSVDRILANLIVKGYVKMGDRVKGKSFQIRLTDKGVEALGGANKQKQFSREHELTIASGLLALIRPRRYYIEGDLNPKPEYLKIGFEHLKTGYPDIYCVLKDLHRFKLDARKDPKNQDAIEGVKDAQEMLRDKVGILVEKLQETEGLNPESRCDLCGWRPSDDEKKEIEDLLELFNVERMH